MDKLIHFPSEVTDYVSSFDRFAASASRLVSRSGFFIFSLTIVVLWAPTYFLFRDFTTWNLLINSATTILTFLMLSVLQNAESRSNQAVHHKLNALVDALADHMQETRDGKSDEAINRINKDIAELKRAIGIEEIESS